MLGTDAPIANMGLCVLLTGAPNESVGKGTTIYKRSTHSQPRHTGLSCGGATSAWSRATCAPPRGGRRRWRVGCVGEGGCVWAKPIVKLHGKQRMKRKPEQEYMIVAKKPHEFLLHKNHREKANTKRAGVTWCLERGLCRSPLQ